MCLMWRITWEYYWTFLLVTHTCTHTLPCCQVPLSRATFHGHDSWWLMPFCQLGLCSGWGCVSFLSAEHSLCGLTQGGCPALGRLSAVKYVNFRFNTLGHPRPFSTPELPVVNSWERFHPRGPQAPQLLHKLHLLNTGQPHKHCIPSSQQQTDSGWALTG